MFKRFIQTQGLTNLKGSQGEYVIGITGNILDTNGNKIETRKDSDGHHVVRVKGWNGLKDYRVIDLMAIQFKGLVIPEKDYDKVIAFCIDGNKDNLRAENIGYRFKDGKLAVDNQDGFYYIPGYPRCAINENGSIINVTTTKVLNLRHTLGMSTRNIKGGYLITNVPFEPGVTVTISRHRALGLVFKEFPDNSDKLVVNHINGIPGDDRLENLEWVTRGQNNTHAYVNDLKNQHMRVLVRDVRTGNVTEYYSISETARALGWATDETIRFRLYKCPFGKVFQDGKQFKLKSDERDWIFPNDPEQAIKDAQRLSGVLVRDCATLKVTSYESVTEASKALKISNGTIHWRCDRNLTKPCFGYQFMYSDSQETFPNFTDEEYRNSLKPNSCKTYVKNLLTGEEFEADSKRMAAKIIGLSKIETHLTSRLALGEQVVIARHWMVKTTEAPWQEIDNLEDYLYRQRRDIMALEVHSRAIIVCENAQQMSEVLKLDPKAIREAALTRGEKVYRGYRFRLGWDFKEPWPNDSFESGKLE